MTDHERWRQELFAGPWRVAEYGSQPGLIELRVEGGTPGKPLPVCSVGILIGDGRIDSVCRALAEAIASLPQLLRDKRRLETLLAEQAGADDLEEAVLLARSVENDYRVAKGTGTEPTISAWTWDKVRAFLRRHGQPCED